MKDARLEIRIKTDVKQELDKLAKDNNRKLSDYTTLLIEYAIKKKLKL